MGWIQVRVRSIFRCRHCWVRVRVEGRGKSMGWVRVEIEVRIGVWLGVRAVLGIGLASL